MMRLKFGGILKQNWDLVQCLRLVTGTHSKDLFLLNAFLEL